MEKTNLNFLHKILMLEGCSTFFATNEGISTKSIGENSKRRIILKKRMQ